MSYYIPEQQFVDSDIDVAYAAHESAGGTTFVGVRVLTQAARELRRLNVNLERLLDLLEKNSSQASGSSTV